MVRLVLVLDEESGLPVWYDIIPGNILDINTIMNVVNDVADSLGIVIDSLVFDAGYVSNELVEAFHIGTEKTLIGRMPARKGYPFKELYWEIKPLIGRGKYNFARKHHVYFGHRKEITLFGHKEYAYVYVDQYNALKRYSDYPVNHAEEFEGNKDKDKDWTTVRHGYFGVDFKQRIQLQSVCLPTNLGGVILKQCSDQQGISWIFFPISNEPMKSVRGKILHDIVDTIVRLLIRKQDE